MQSGKPAGAVTSNDKPRPIARGRGRSRAAHVDRHRRARSRARRRRWCSGSLVLLGGEPGIGKSTLLLQALDGLARAGKKRALRLGRRVGAADGAAREPARRAQPVAARAGRDRSSSASSTRPTTMKPAVLAVDSVQTMHSAALESIPGSLGQVREAAGRLLTFAKTKGVPVVLVGHVTKDGGAGRAEDARARRRLRALLRRRAHAQLPHPAHDEEPLRLDERDRRLRDARRRARRGAEPVGAVPGRAAARRARLGGRRRRSRARGRSSSRSRRSWRTRRACRGAPRSASIPTACRCCSR